MNADATDPDPIGDAERPARAEPHRPPVLVIGVGSELRRDDAAGRRIADAVDAMALPEVEVRSVHQLTPELATAFSRRRLVVVVDASVDVTALSVDIVDATDAAGAMSHHLDVGSLVALSRLFAEPPERVVTVAVPAHDLGLGTQLSPGTEGWLLPAAGRVAELCEEALGHRL